MQPDPSRNDLFLAQEMGVTDLQATRAQLTTTEIALVLSSELATDRLAQLTILTAANILCRLGPYCPRIAIVAPPHALVAPGVPLLPLDVPFDSTLGTFMASIQSPESRLDRQYRIGFSTSTYTAALVVGDVPVNAGHVLYADYNRWTGGFGGTPANLSYGGANPFGALLAGALGAAAISRLLLAPFAASDLVLTPLPDRVLLSAYSYGVPSDPSAEPDILGSGVDLESLDPLLLVGAGAVASGMVYALLCLPTAVGTLHVADDDVLDVTNLERHLVSTWAGIGTLKVDRIADTLADGRWNGVRLHPHPYHYDHLPSVTWRTVVATVDKPEPRRHLQFDLPQVLLNGATVGSEYLVSRHDYGPGPCAECLYPERPAIAQSPLKMLATQTGLEMDTVQHLQETGVALTEVQIAQIVAHGALVFPPEALAEARRTGISALLRAACTTATIRPGLPAATIGFVAALPGLLLAAELVKEAMRRGAATVRPPLVADRNVFRADTFGDLVGELEHARPSRQCRCQTDIMQATYRHKWEGQSAG